MFLSREQQLGITATSLMESLAVQKEFYYELWFDFCNNLLVHPPDNVYVSPCHACSSCPVCFKQIVKLRQQLQCYKQGGRCSKDKDRLSPLKYNAITLTALTSTTSHASTTSHIQVVHCLENLYQCPQIGS